MTENQFDKFICLIQKNKYQVELMEYNTRTFKKVLMVKSKFFLVPKILISFTDVSRSGGKDFLDELEALNKEVNNNKPLIVILIMSVESELKDNLWFNGNIYFHLVVHNEKLNCLYFENKFYYFGAKKIKNLIGLLNQSLYRNKLIKMNDVINNYINYAKISGKTPFFESNIALRIIEECRGLNMKILGIDAVKMTNESTQPFMEHSIDFSIKPDDYVNIWDSAFDFIKLRENLGLLFEIVIESRNRPLRIINQKSNIDYARR